MTTFPRSSPSAPTARPRRVRRSFGAALLLAGMVAGCRQPDRAGTLDGTWVSEGYGNVYQFDGPLLTQFEVTSASCIPLPDSLFALPADSSGRFRYARRGAATPSLQVVSDSGAGQRRIHRLGAASDIVIKPIPKLPALCATPVPDTPIANFDVFVRTWNEHYILFDQKPVPWAARVDSARARVTDSTGPAQLFDILSSLIAPFEDAHSFLAAPALDQRWHGLRRGTDAAIPGGIATLAKTGPSRFLDSVAPALFRPIERAHLTSELRRWCNGQVQFGRIGSIGYLRILSFSNYTDGDSYLSQRAALDAALDTVLTGDPLTGLIIDVRINFGGSDALALAVAERLATEPYLGYTKEARADPVDRSRWTRGQPSEVRPSSRPGFRGQVVELIGPLTISAGETFTQALMGRVPQVRRVGEPTQGVFSDVLGRRLPNGWRFGLPNEVFRTPDGRTFDGPGIPPTHAVPVFAPPDRAAGRDPAIELALSMLRNP